MSTIPYVIEQTSRGERSYDIFSRLLSDRIVFLGEEVSDVSASLMLLECVPNKIKDIFRNEVIAEMIKRTQQPNGTYFETFRRLKIYAKK